MRTLCLLVGCGLCLGASASAQHAPAGGDPFSSAEPAIAAFPPEARSAALHPMLAPAAEDRSRTLAGALIGGAATALLGLFISSRTCGSDDGDPGRDCTLNAVRAGVVAFPVGALIGAGIGSAGEE